jgi:hypothetical protein
MSDRLDTHFHTLLILLAFVGTLIAYSLADGPILEDLLLLLGGGVAGAANPGKVVARA